MGTSKGAILGDNQLIAETLLKLKAVTISPTEPYTWASGLKSPLYCDNRLIISTVKERRHVAASFVRKLEALDWRPTVIAGTATAGIPHAAWIAELLSLPMVYIRSSEKKHGKQNRIEGRVPQGAKAVVIEDLISTGGSSVSAAQVLQDQGVEVIGVLAIFQYGMAKAKVRFHEAGLPFDTLTNLETLLKTAMDLGSLTKDEYRSVIEWSNDPQGWSDAQS